MHGIQKIANQTIQSNLRLTRNNPFNKSVLQSSQEVFKMVDLEEPAKKAKSPVKLPTIKMRK